MAKTILDSRQLDLVFENTFLEQIFHDKKVSKDPLKNLTLVEVIH